MIKISIEKKEAFMRLGGWPGGLRGALGGKTRGVKNAKDERNLMFGDFFLHFWPQLVQLWQGNDKKPISMTKFFGDDGSGTVNSTVWHAVLHSPSGRAADLIAQRAVRRAWVQVLHPQIEKCKSNREHRKVKSEHRPKEGPKRHPRTENWPQQARKWMAPRGAEEGSKIDPKNGSRKKVPLAQLSGPPGSPNTHF